MRMEKIASVMHICPSPELNITPNCIYKVVALTYRSRVKQLVVLYASLAMTSACLTAAL